MDVKEFFGKHADKYSMSQSHAKGTDLDVLMDMLKPGSEELALGVATGTGFTALALALRVKSVVGIDRTPQMLEESEKLASKRNISNVEFVIGDAEQLPYGDSTFNIVTSRRAPHHFADKGKFLSESFRVLERGGRIGISDMVAPEKAAEEYNQFERRRDPSHASAETFSGWKKLLENAGFIVSDSVKNEERVTFEKWLYPVLTDSEDGKRSMEYLSETPAMKDSISFNEDETSFIKSRGVFVAVKP